MSEEQKMSLDLIREALLSANVESIERKDDQVPRIQLDSMSSIDFQIGSFRTMDYIDNVGYIQSSSSSLLNHCMTKIAGLDNLAATGEEYISFLYSYRAVSRAIPDNEDDESSSDEDSSESGGGETTTTDREVRKKTSMSINLKTVDILRPEMLKINDLYAYTNQAVEAFRDCVNETISSVSSSSSSEWESNSLLLNMTRTDIMYKSMLNLINVLVKLDFLKKAKTGYLVRTIDQV